MGLFNRDRCEGKTPEQLAGMRTAGLLVGRTLELLVASVRPGMTTLDLDTLAETHIRDHGGVPNFQLVPGFRHTLCTSVNEEIVHGIPGSRVLREGDLVSIDCGAQVGLWNGDAAVSVVVGGRTPPAPRTSSSSTTPRPASGPVSPPCASARACMPSARPSRTASPTPGSGAAASTASSRTTSATASARRCTWTRRCPTTGSRARAPRSSTARRSASSRWWSSATRTTSCSTTSGRWSPATGPVPPTGALGRRDGRRPHGAHGDRRRRGPAARPRRRLRPHRPRLTDPRPPDRAPADTPTRRPLASGRCARSLR